MLIFGVSRPIRAAVFLIGAVLAGAEAIAEVPYVDRYVAAVRLARAGRSDTALERLTELARASPSSVPIHRALAELALSTGHSDVWTERFGTRRRRDSRDIGAAVGLAVLESSKAHPAEAGRLLLDAVASGARDPLLVPLLVRNAARADDLVGWFAARASVLPRDARFAALRADVLLSLDRVAEARDVLDAALALDPRRPELLALHAELLRAAGDTDRACDEASTAARQWSGEQRVPEARVPARLGLARVWISCGQKDEAQRFLGTLGPLVTLPGCPSLPAMASVVEAELALAREDPLTALALLEDSSVTLDDDPVWGEVARAVRTRSMALLGFKPISAADIARLPPPTGLAIADRSAALAACAAAEDSGDPAYTGRLETIAARLAAQRLAPRSGRLRALARFLAAKQTPGAGGAEQATAPAPGPAAVEAGPELRVAAALTEAHRRLAAGDTRGALEAASPRRDTVEGAPGILLAALGAIAARTALALGEPQRGAVAVRESLLDIEAFSLARGALAPETEPLVGASTDTALELAGLAFRAAIAGGRSPAQAADELLRNLGRVARGWSVVAAPWPTTVTELSDSIPADSCLLITTCGPQAPALALDRRRGFAVATVAGAPSTQPCARKRRLLWAGPGAPRGGLSLGNADQRVLIRAIVPSPPREPEGARTGAPPVVDIGPGPERPLRHLVEVLAAQPALSGEAWASRFDAAREWAVFHGAGLASATAPSSAGWLAPPGLWTPSGWVGPETLQTLPAPPGAGLVALGVAAPEGLAVEKGARVLAEAALSAGWSWALFSRRPLTNEERRAVESRLRDWAADPLKEAERVVKKDPALSAALMLWASPQAPQAGARRYYVVGLVAAACAALAALWVTRRLVRRHAGQARTSSRRPVPPPDSG